MAPGGLGRARSRDWVVLPPDEPDVVRLRPVDGSDNEAVGIYLPLEPEALEPSEYQKPDPNLAGDFTGSLLLRDAVRLGFREAALGRSVRWGGVKPYVQDGRNILMMQPPGDEESNEFLLSLLYALKRAIQFVYQVEEQEVGAELIGQGEHHRLLLWEEAEGGTGIWERLAREPHALAEVARQALALCHFDPDTGDDANEHDSTKCAVACYEWVTSRQVV